MEFGKFRYWHHTISIVADAGQYIWEISTKCTINCSKYKNFVLSPPVGTTIHLAVLQFYYFGTLACTAMAFCEVSFLSIIKSPVDHTSYKYCVLGMVKYKYSQYSPYILARWSLKQWQLPKFRRLHT